MSKANLLLGYVVIFVNAATYDDDGPAFVDFIDGRNVIVSEQPAPIPVADAYRRLAGFLDQHPNVDPISFEVAPVYAPEPPPPPPVTPLNGCAKELASRLRALTGAHGLDLGLSDEEMERQIEQELVQFGALAKQVRGLLR